MKIWQNLSNGICHTTPAGKHYPPLKKLKCHVPGALVVSFSPQQAPMKEESDILSRFDHPLYPAVADKFKNLPEDQLRWKVVTWPSITALKKACLRNHLKQKWSKALVDVLKSKALSSNGQGLAGSASKHPGLKGTLQIMVHAGCGFSESNATILRHCEVILREVEKTQLQVTHNTGNNNKTELRPFRFRIF